MTRHKWPVDEQASFLKRVGELLVQGYPIAEAIESISLHLPKKRKEELYECLQELKKGLPFHDVLDRLGFHNDLIGYVYYAQQHGSFAEALLEGSGLVQLKDRDLKKLLKMLQYPIFLLVLTGLLFGFVENTLLPRFTSLFASLGLEDNFFTKVVYAFDLYFPLFIKVFIAVISLAGCYYFFIFRKYSILKQRTLLVRLPIAGPILKLLFTHYFAMQLSFLLQGGISIPEALSLFEQNQKQPFFSQLGAFIKTKLVTGETLDTILSSFSFFEKEFPIIVKHGQENGKLEQELLFFSRHCIEEMEDRIEQLLKIVQPLLYLFIGLLVVSMYLAILLPMFHLLDSI
ncbi:competence type IV pilus assembly protein ComGB [Neobacillus sp. Marseille-QA0830]